MGAAPSIPAARRLAAFDPWHEDPPAEILGALPASFWREQRALPLGFEDGAVLLGAAHPIGDAAASRVRSATYRDVRRVVVADDEMEAWLEVSLGDASWEQALVSSLQSLIRAIGLAARRQVSVFAMPGRSTDVETIARAFDIGEDAAVEVLALRARLPQIRLERYKRPPYLSAILPSAAARELRLVPVAAHRGLVVVATPRVPGPAARARIRSEVGVDVRIALCAPSAFPAAFSQIYADEPPPSAPPDADAVYERLSRTGTIGPARRTPLDRLASVTVESRLSAAVRLGYVTAEDVRDAAAHVADLARLSDATAQLDRGAAELAYPAFWRSHRCAPVSRSDRSVTIASDRSLGPRRVELVRRIVGAREATVRYADGAAVDALLVDLPASSRSAYTGEEHLLAAGLVAPERADAARKQALRENVPLVRALLDRGSVEVEDVVEAAAIAAARPWLHADRCSPDSAAAESLDATAARAALATPIARRGASLLVAFLDPLADLAAVDAATPLAVDAIYAASADPSAVLSRWYAVKVKVTDDYAAFGRALIARGWLTRPQVDRGLEDLARGRRLDAVFTGRGLLSPEQLAVGLGAHLRIPLAEIEQRERTTRVIDALGTERDETVVDDPIDVDVARRLPRESALRHACIPVRSRGNAVEVAFVDPLDGDARTAVHAALGAISISVATRRDVEVAQRRAYARPSVGERLIEVGVITREQLERALEVHDRTGVRVGAALVSLGSVTELELAAAIAEQADLPFVDLRSAEPDPDVARLISPENARELGVLPLWDDGDSIAVACAEQHDAASLAAIPGLAGRTLRPVVVTEAALDDALNAVWRDEYLDISATQLLSRSPEDSARWVLSRGQRAFFVALGIATLAGLIASPVLTITAYVALSTFFYVGFSAYKFYLAYRAMGTTLEIDVTAEDLGLLDERDLPVYTILVPVYREARVFPILAKALERLDYPKPKLDVKILLEEDDLETIDVARNAGLPSYVDLLVVPSGGPKGKPKACNYGLIHAKGEYVVIFDAEDIPEPDQLKKAVVAFRKGDERLACVQAKLNYFNRDQNLLTRWFTTEYSMWFDLFLPGLDASHAPIPLGGTSNHFPTARLRELGAWDPFNVTEDADLGMRLYKKGWTTAVIDSTTYEEANSEVYNWIRQRSRWVKGYIQTYLVHMRDPLKLYRQVGFKAFVSFQFVVGGTFFGYLVNPLYWLLTVTWFLFHWGIVREIFPAPVFYLGSIGLYVGNFAFTYLNVAGCLRREYYDMVKYALLSPIYWAFMSVAAWKGMLQLFYKPSYWEKTEHGLYHGQIRLRRTPARHAA
ncbi:MAG: glycosyltransferase [Chloroflexota bacterium]|nr:glycosyltransferase [Chloroflexota bacterium]